MANPPFKLRWGVFLLLALVALALRLPRLGERPMHTDEAINAYIVGQLLAGDSFHYDPVDRHGPALAALTLPVVRLEGAKDFRSLTERGLRLGTVLVGAATVLLFAAAVDLFGFMPCLVAALLFAVAPLPVYYSRDFIHEGLFLAATLGLLCAGWRALHRPSIPAAICTGTCAALMLAAKETAVLHFIAFVAAALFFFFMQRKTDPKPKRVQLRVILTATATFVLLSLLLFTWFGRNWTELAGLMHAVPDAMSRAQGQGHQKPFWYYLQLLSGGWSGTPISVLALVGLVLAFRQTALRAWRWLGLYFLLIVILYCTIPYKTPWLSLNLLLPGALLAGLTVEFLWRSSNNIAGRAVLLVSAAGFGMLLAHDTRMRVFTDPAGEDNPYAYVQTSEDLLGLPARLDELVQQRHLVSPRIAVIASDPWPLPWYLRTFPQTGFWKPGQQTGPADFFITSADPAKPDPNQDRYESQFEDFRPEFFGLRPNVLVILWVPQAK